MSNPEDVTQMREHIKNLEGQLAELRPQAEEAATLKDALHAAAFERAGLDPNKGIGKAAFVTYKGASDPSLIVEFAKQEFGYEPATPAKAAVSNDSQRLAALESAAVADQPSSLEDEIKTAESEGNWTKSLALKAQQARQALA